MQQVRESVRISSDFRHATRSLAPGEALPMPPTLLQQLLACRDGMLSGCVEEIDELDEIDEDGDEVFEVE